MTKKEAKDFLNESPYLYESLGNGVKLRFDFGGNVKICVERNRKKGGIDVSCKEDVFHFVFDFQKQEWKNPPLKKASAR